MSNYVIVTGYTFDTDYVAAANNLVQSCNRLNVPVLSYGYQSLGEWTKNTMVKSKIILEALTSQDRDVIWLDADAEMKSYPLLFDKLADQCDISFRYHRGIELLSGTLYLKNNEVVRNLVKEWSEVTEVNWDQRILQELIEGPYKNKLVIYPLPEEYVKINPRDNEFKQLECVIGHKQMSRQQRKTIGYEQPKKFKRLHKR